MALKTTTSFAAISVLGASLLCAVVVTPAGAQQQPASSMQEKEHVVKKGDTLWDLAGTYLSNPFLWPCIYQANRAAIRNPNLILPAEHLVIPPKCGTVPPAPATEVAHAQTEVLRPTEAPARTDVESLPVPAHEYYAAPWLSEASRVPAVGRLMGGVDPSAVRERLPQSMHPHERLYVQYVGSKRPAEGDRLLVVSLSRRVKDRGWVVLPAGVLVVDSLRQDVMVATLAMQFRQVFPGFLAIPLDSMPEQALGAQQDVVEGPAGVIIDFLEQHPLNALGDVAFVTLGREQGLELGDELLSYVPERRDLNEEKLRLPAEPIARMLVVRVDDHAATARVLSLRTAALKPGVPVRVSRKRQ